jgi:hypothetical protein
MGLVSAWACMIAHNIVLFIMFLVVDTKEKRRNKNE